MGGGHDDATYMAMGPAEPADQAPAGQAPAARVRTRAGAAAARRLDFKPAEAGAVAKPAIAAKRDRASAGLQDAAGHAEEKVRGRSGLHAVFAQSAARSTGVGACARRLRHTCSTHAAFNRARQQPATDALRLTGWSSFAPGRRRHV